MLFVTGFACASFSPSFNSIVSSRWLWGIFSYLGFHVVPKGSSENYCAWQFLPIQNSRKLQLVIMAIYFYREPSFRKVPEEIHNKTPQSGTEEMAQQLRVFDDITGDLSLVHSTHVRQLIAACNSISRGFDALIWTL